MRIAIVDDQREDRALLREGIARWARENGAELGKTMEFASAEAFLASAEAEPFELVFLDVYMEGATGMEAARRLRQAKQECRIVFTTTSADFAVESYEVNASHYLLKPFSYTQLAQAMERCGASLMEECRAVTVPGRYGEEKLLLHRIAYAEYVGRKVLVHFLDGLETQVNMGWTEFSSLLVQYPFFCDCMKGVLVSFSAVKKLTADSFLLHDGQTIPISRLKYKDVRKQFFDWSIQKARGN